MVATPLSSTSRESSSSVITHASCMVPTSIDHTLAIAEAIPYAQLAIVPGSTHQLMTERSGLVNRIVLDFLAEFDRSSIG